MQVLVNGLKMMFSPSCCNPVIDQATARKAPPMPMEDSDDEEEPAVQEPEGDCVPGRRVVNKQADEKDEKQNLKGN